MKRNQFVNLLVIGLALTIAASGCRKKPVNPTPLPGARAGNVREAPPGGVITPGPTVTPGEGVGSTPGGIPMAAAGAHEGWIEDAASLKSETVYFDFDSSVIKTGEKPKISAVADYLKANLAKAVRVEGNCDERGTEEYNRALGERRALALREVLMELGVDGSRIPTESFGKDKPIALGHDESAWRLNRRGDFVVLVPPGAP